MNNSLSCYRITSCDDTLYPKLVEIFEASFPKSERRPLPWLKQLVESEPRFHCMAYIANSSLLTPHSSLNALLCYWHFGTFIYVEYLAANPSQRNAGIGTRLMSEFLADADAPVILEVEPPESELTERRIGFYRRLGFRLLPDAYEQPSYGVVPGIPLRLMLHGEHTVPTAEMIKTIHREVYNFHS